MAVGTVQLYNTGLEELVNDAGTQWDVGSATTFAWVLCTTSYTPLDTHQAYSDLTGFVVGGDGIPIDVNSMSLDLVSDTVQFNSGHADWSSPVTITARYLILVKGNFGSLSGTDRLVFWCDLDVGGTGAVASAAQFQVQKPATGWFTINQ